MTVPENQPMTPGKELAAKLACIRLVAADVDGTFTDGTLYYDTNGSVIKGFSSRDGMGLELLRRAGIKRGLISGRKDNATDARARFIGVDFYESAIGDKAVILGGLAERYGLTLDECLFVGDDLNDLTAIQAAGVGAVVGNASPAVKKFADVITEAHGGQGAVREIADIVLAAQGFDTVALWMSDKDTPVGMQPGRK